LVFSGVVTAWMMRFFDSLFIIQPELHRLWP
jgi:hypothetical protein